MNALIGLLLCLAAASALPLKNINIPVGKEAIYNYYADVKAGIIEPAQYASQFGLAGELRIKELLGDEIDSNVETHYYVKLNKVKYGLYNGKVSHYERIQVDQNIDEEAQQIENPFVIIYVNGKLEGIKVPKIESLWSKNIKMGIASMLQLDLDHIQVQHPIKPHAFVTQEKTIHGTCQVSYDVHPEDQKHPEASNVFVVTKMHDLKNCSNFVQRVFDVVECEKCHVESEDDMTTAARRVFHIEQHEGKELVVKHLVAHSVINYFPYKGRSEAHYLLTNTTLDLQSLVPVSEPVPEAVNFQDIPIIRNITYNKPVGNYALHAAEDLTHGRHMVKLDEIIPKLKKMLLEAAEYLEENQMKPDEPDWKHGQTINRIQEIMSYMDLGSFEQVYNTIKNPKTPTEITMKNIFLTMVPTAGTTAACHFTRNVVRKHKENNMTVISMLAKLPMHVKIPSERLLLEMEDLLKFTDVPAEVKKASILCFSVLIRKTFLHHQDSNTLLNRYIHYFFEHVKNEPSYQMKVVYLMAMRNVQVGNIEKLLEPIIRGEIQVSENPYAIRTQAIWTVKEAIADKVEYAHDLLWPILADVTNPLSIRIVAYDVLMSQMPNLKRLMNIYWFMVYEKNNHLYNYHLTTLKGLANSVDPCLEPVREMARKVLSFTRIRPVTTSLSNTQFVEYIDPVYGHGESVKLSWVLNPLTGTPEGGYIEYHASVARKPVNVLGVYWHVYGVDEAIKLVKEELFGDSVKSLSNKDVQNILVRAAKDMPVQKSVQVDILVTLNNHVVIANYYNKDNFVNVIRDVIHDVLNMKQTILGNYQEVVYSNLYEMQVPTDMGMQAVLGTKTPQLWSVKFNELITDKGVADDLVTDVKKPSVNVKIAVDTRVWKHGGYAMTIYNPIVDIWHSIRRSVAEDVALPVEATISYNHASKSLKVSMPRLPVKKLSHIGVRHFAKNLVTVEHDEKGVLKPCCHHYTVVTTDNKKTYHEVVNLKDMGLEYLTMIYGCENGITPESDKVEWQRDLSPEHKTAWDSMILRYLMGVRQKWVNDFISPQKGSCGMLQRIQPSVVHPTSQVDLSVRVNVEDIDHIHEKMSRLSNNKINIRGTLDVKAASTNESVRSWDVNVNAEMSQGHLANNVKIQMTRVTPGEKNLKICVEAQMNYPKIETDILKVDVTKQEINGKVTINAGYTDDDKCVRDEMSISMTVKGEMTEDQKKQLAHDSVHGACIKDTQNPQFQTKQNHVAKTMNCIQEAIKCTTLKKYTFNASYKKMPIQVLSKVAWIEDQLRALYLPHIKYTSNRVQSGNAQVVVEVASDMSHLNASVVTPVNGYEYVQIPLHHQLVEGMVMGEPVPHPQWHLAMENTHFSISAMNKVVEGQLKICTVYPQVLISFDNGVIPLVVSDQWTLVSGNYVDQTYAIFVKSVEGDKFAVKIYVGGHQLEIAPSKSNVVVSVDDNVVEQHEKGVIVPKDKPNSYAIKLTEDNEHLVVQSQQVPVITLWTPNTVTLVTTNVLQGHVTGICGHMDDTHKEKLPKIYSVSHL